MDIIKELLKSSKSLIALSIIVSVFSALAGVSVISMVNQMIVNPELTREMAVKGAATLLLLFITGVVSQLLLNRLGHGVVYRLRMIMVKRVMDLKLEQLERIGGHTFYAVLTKDISTIGSAFNAVPFIVYNAVLVIGGFAYMGWLSVHLFVTTLSIVSIGVVVSYFVMEKMRTLMKVVRETDDHIFSGYQGIIDGNGEMQLNAKRKLLFYQEDIEPVVAKSKDFEIKADTYWVFSKNWAVVVILGLVFSLFFIGPLFNLTTEIIAGFVLVLMFLRTPINDLMSDYPLLVKAKVSMNKIDSLKLPVFNEEFPVQVSNYRDDLPDQLLKLERIKYEYDHEEGEYGFSLGPIDLEVCKGELVFVIGGNGSGKSTLAKLITGLYSASSGEIILGGTRVNNENLEWYRSHFSTVFSTFYLFKRLVGPDEKLDTELANSFLQELNMDKKVGISAGSLTKTSLSQGQRKRLALLLAYVEQRPIWLLDEWAADQDPEFRTYFYLELLPSLKKRGITIIAISHDDHFFHVADKIYKCDSGQLSLLNLKQASMEVSSLQPA